MAESYSGALVMSTLIVSVAGPVITYLICRHKHRKYVIESRKELTSKLISDEKPLDGDTAKFIERILPLKDDDAL